MRDRLVQAPGAVQRVPALQVPAEDPGVHHTILDVLHTGFVWSGSNMAIASVSRQRISSKLCRWRAACGVVGGSLRQRLTWSRHGTMVLKYTPAPSELATALTCGRLDGKGGRTANMVMRAQPGQCSKWIAHRSRPKAANKGVVRSIHLEVLRTAFALSLYSPQLGGKAVLLHTSRPHVSACAPGRATAPVRQPQI